MNELSTTTLLLSAFVGFACVFLVFWILISWWLTRRQALTGRRIRSPDDSDPTLLLNDMLVTQGPMGWWRRLIRVLQDRLDRTELRLEVFEAAALTLFCGVVVAAVVFFWRYEEDEGWMAFPAFFLGASVPLGIFLWRQQNWRRRIQEQLPDMLFLMARTMRAGMSIDQSIQVLGDHGVAPLSREFSRMHRQLDLGLALPQVLNSTASRLALVDFSVFASILSLHRNTGGNLPVVMDRLAQTTRERNQMRGYYRTATSMGRYGGVMALLLVGLVLFYLLFFQRDLSIRYFDSARGFTMFCIGIGMEIAGILLLWYLSRDEI